MARNTFKRTGSRGTVAGVFAVAHEACHDVYFRHTANGMHNNLIGIEYMAHLKGTELSLRQSALALVQNRVYKGLEQLPFYHQLKWMQR